MKTSLGPLLMGMCARIHGHFDFCQPVEQYVSCASVRASVCLMRVSSTLFVSFQMKMNDENAPSFESSNTIIMLNDVCGS